MGKRKSEAVVRTAYKREWRKSHPLSVLLSARKYRRNSGYYSVINKNYKSNNPEKHKCRRITYVAIKKGILIRPTQCCSCSVPCKPHAHHEDYSNPMDVTWLCRGCHLKVHGKMKGGFYDTRGITIHVS